MPDPPPRRFDRPQALFDAAELQTVLAAANHDPAQLAEAAVFYRAAASGFAARRRDPGRLTDWAHARHRHACTLLSLGELPAHRQQHQRAIRVLRAILRLRRREHDPVLWSITQGDLGRALFEQGLLEHSGAVLREAAFTLRNALSVLRPHSAPAEWATAQEALAYCLQTLGAVQRDPLLLQQAVGAFDALLEANSAAMDPLERAATEAELGNTLQELGRAQP